MSEEPKVTITRQEDAAEILIDQPGMYARVQLSPEELDVLYEQMQRVRKAIKRRAIAWKEKPATK